jgi:hypothetical protein
VKLLEGAVAALFSFVSAGLAQSEAARASDLDKSEQEQDLPEEAQAVRFLYLME